jgi:phosphoserine phosphatase RsbU/P
MVEPEREIHQLQIELQREQRHQALLRDIALAGRGASNPQQVFALIYERLCEILPVDAFYVALCDHEGALDYRFAFFIDDGKRYELSDTRVGGLTGYLLDRKQPLLFRNMRAEYQQRDIPAPQRFGQTEKTAKAWMGVPILAGRDAIGVLSVQSYREGVYDERDLHLLEALADMAGIAVENALLYEAQEQLSQSLAERVTARSEELAVLTAIATSFSQGQPISILLEEVLERVLWLLGMSAGAIYLHEPSTLLHRVAWRAADNNPFAEWLPVSGPSREAEAIANEELSETQINEQAVVTAPLRAFGKTTGAITLLGPARTLTLHERTLIEAACYQIAVGIENSRLLREREGQIARLEGLNQIAAASSATLDMRPMLEQSAIVLRNLLPLDGLVVAAYDRERDELTTGLSWDANVGQNVIDHKQLADKGRLGYLMRELRPVLLRHTDPRHTELVPQRPWEEGALSWMGVPLLSRTDEPIGLLAVQSRRPDAFNERDLQFLVAVAYQLAMDIENAQLYQSTRASAAIAERRAENLALVHNISRLVNSSLNPQEVLGIASEQMVKLFGVDHCGIVIYTSAGWTGEIVAEYPAVGALHQHISFPNVDDFRADIAMLGQPIYIADAANDPRVHPIQPLTQKLGIGSMLIVPLISRGRAVGAIGLNNRGVDRPFSAEELELCRTIAAQVAIALENARLFQLSVTRLEQEMDIARSIQANLFPSSLPHIPHADLAARCVPARETGGDFYDVLPLGHDRFGLSIGDVSGKSLPAAMLMAVARSVVRSEALDHALPADVMCQANQLVAQDVPPDTYVALCYAVYDARARTLELALGGQLTPLLRRRDGTTEFINVVGELPLGIVPDVDYKTTTVQLEPGDTVLFYTDGLVEGFSPAREMFGFERLQTTFSDLGDQPAAAIVDGLLAAVDRWHDYLERHDDMTAVVLRVQ